MQDHLIGRVVATEVLQELMSEVHNLTHVEVIVLNHKRGIAHIISHTHTALLTTPTLL